MGYFRNTFHEHVPSSWKKNHEPRSEASTDSIRNLYKTFSNISEGLLFCLAETKNVFYGGNLIGAVKFQKTGERCKQRELFSFEYCLFASSSTLNRVNTLWSFCFELTRNRQYFQTIVSLYVCKLKSKVKQQRGYGNSTKTNNQGGDENREVISCYLNQALMSRRGRRRRKVVCSSPKSFLSMGLFFKEPFKYVLLVRIN